MYLQVTYSKWNTTHTSNPHRVIWGLFLFFCMGREINVSPSPELARYTPSCLLWVHVRNQADGLVQCSLRHFDAHMCPQQVLPIRRYASTNEGEAS